MHFLWASIGTSEVLFDNEGYGLTAVLFMRVDLYTRQTAALQSPTSRSPKNDMQAWLTEHEVVWNEDMLKKELFHYEKVHT